MKWMGWNWDDYLAAPVDLVTEIVEVMGEERREAKIQRKVRGRR